MLPLGLNYQCSQVETNPLFTRGGEQQQGSCPDFIKSLHVAHTSDPCFRSLSRLITCFYLPFSFPLSLYILPDDDQPDHDPLLLIAPKILRIFLRCIDDYGGVAAAGER